MNLNNIPSEIMESLPLYLYAKDIQGKYLYINNYHAKQLGFRQCDDIIGLTDRDLNCLPKEQAINLQINDKKIIASGNRNTFIEPVTLVNNDKPILVSQKLPLYSREKKIIGIMGASFAINSEMLNSKFFHKKLGNLISTSLVANCKLSKRQYDCLYLLLKGFATKQIAQRLNLSPRTIEHYINIIKQKFNCSTRQDIIEKINSLEWPE